jgi:hypothetical protein
VGAGSSVEPGWVVGVSVAVAEEPHAIANMAINIIRRETIDLGLRVAAIKSGFLHAFFVGF